MADLFEETARSINGSALPTEDPRFSPQAKTYLDRQRTLDEVASGIAREGRTSWDTTKDIVSQTLTAALIQNGAGPRFPSDPTNWTFDKYKKRFGDAQKELPEDMWSDLHGAQSEQEFDWLLARAKGHVEAQRNIAEAGWDAGAANLLAQFLDPASLAIGIGTGVIGIRGAQALNLARSAQRVANAAAGAGGGLATIGAMDYAGLPATQADYLMAAGLGLTLGAAFGPLGQRQATRAESVGVSKVGEDLQALAAEMKAAEAIQPAPVPQAGVKRAAEAAQAAPEPVPAPAPQPVAPKTSAPTPEATLGDAAEAAVKGTPLADVLPDGSLKAIVDGAVPTPKAAKPPPPETQPGLLVKDPEQAKAKLQALDDETATAEIELTPALKKNPRNIAAYVTFDGDEYRIVSIGDDATGPYKVIKNDGKVVANNLETLAEARAKVPGVSGPQSAGRAADELEAIPKAVGPADALLAADYSKLKLAELKKLAEERGVFVDKKTKAEYVRRLKAADIQDFIDSSREAKGKQISLALAELKPLKGNLDGDEAGFRFRGFEYRRGEDIDGKKNFTIHDKDGKQIGDLEIAVQDGKPYVSWVGVEPAFEGTPAGYGAGLVAQRYGAYSLPDGYLSAKSYGPAAKQLSWVRDWYRRDPNRAEEWWMSPKRLLEDYENLRLDMRSAIERSNAAIAKGEKVGAAVTQAIGNLRGRINRLKNVIDTLPPEALDPDNLSRMIAAKGQVHPMSQVVSKPAARAEIEAILRRILPKGVRSQIDDDILPNGSLDGLYRDRVVYVAMAADNPRAIAYHEAGHAFRQLGMFTDKEWRKLSAWARKTDAHTRYGIKERYAGEKASVLDEEAVMHALGDRMAGKAAGDAAVDTILDKVIDMLRRVRDALGISGFRTLRDIFDDIDSGVIAQRPMAGDLNDAAFRAARRAEVGAQANPAARDEILTDPSWRSLQDEDVPRSGGFWRYDRAGMIGHSENAPGRLIGGALLNDTVGKANHSLNPFSADQDYRRMLNVWSEDFGRTARPAFQEWADELKLSPVERFTREHEFFEEVGLYIRDRDRGTNGGWHNAAVARLGDKVAEIQAEILEHLKNPLHREGLTGRPISGAELTPEDMHYLWRKFNHEKVRGAINEFGEGVGPTGSARGVTLMVMNAIKSAQMGINDAVALKLANGYVKNIFNRAAGLGDEWSMALGERDAERFRRLIMQEARLSPDEAEAIVERLFKGERGEAGQMPNLKKRVLLDETYVERGLTKADGSIGDLAFHDLLDNNVNNLFHHYARRAAGRVALGRVRVQHPDGSPLINGIVSDAEWAQHLEMVKAWGAERGQYDSAKEMVERLQFAYDRIKGVPDPAQQTKPAQWMRLIRSYMSARLLGQVGIAQFGETGTYTGALGFRAVMQQNPGFRRLIDAAGDTRRINPLHHELEALGIGPHGHGLHYHNMDEVGELPFTTNPKPGLDRAQNYGRMAEEATYRMSGMVWLGRQQQIHVAAAMAQRIANMADTLQAGKSLGRGDLRRLAQLNIDEARLTRILDQMKQHSDFVDGAFFGRKLKVLNAQNWTDKEAKAWLEDALFRTANKLVQTGDEGSAAFWMSHPVAQTIFQFRSFPFAAWANQLQYNLHMADYRAAVTMMWSVAWSAAVRAAQLNLIALGRSDKERFLKEKLTPWELGKAGFERSGWSSIIPMSIDTGLAFVGQQGQFNARSTGQASSIFGSPAISFLDSSAKGLGGLVDSAIKGRSPAQSEVRAAAGILPFQNLLPVSAAISALIHDLPERAPPKERRPF